MGQQKPEEMPAACREREKIYEERLVHGTYDGREEFTDCVRGYVLAKFLLPQKEQEDDLNRLAQKSVALLLKLPVEKLKEVDKPGGCTVTTAVSDKKVLLLMRMGKLLGNRIKPDQMPQIKTIGDLADYLYGKGTG